MDFIADTSYFCVNLLVENTNVAANCWFAQYGEGQQITLIPYNFHKGCYLRLNTGKLVEKGELKYVGAHYLSKPLGVLMQLRSYG